MTVQQFFAKYNGKLLDDDGYYGGQCMDVYQRYTKEVVGVKEIRVPAAADVWDKHPIIYEKIKNTPTNFPETGDVIIWGKSRSLPFGHIAICSIANVDEFVSFDQNWPTGSECHYQDHSYIGVVGWLRPKSSANQAQPLAQQITAQTKIPGSLLGQSEDMEIQAIASKLHDLERDFKGALAQAGDLKRQLKECQDLSSNTREKAEKAVSTPLNPLATTSINELLTELLRRVLGR